MANVVYFSGDEPLVGCAIQPLPNKTFATSFPGVQGISYDGFQKLVARNASGEVRPVTRRVFRKANPSNHRCDARCQNAKGNQCECECGGRYHGINC